MQSDKIIESLEDKSKVKVEEFITEKDYQKIRHERRKDNYRKTAKRKAIGMSGICQVGCLGYKTVKSSEITSVLHSNGQFRMFIEG